MKFSIRDLLLVTVIVALAVGWWVDSARLKADVKKQADETERVRRELDPLEWPMPPQSPELLKKGILVRPTYHNRDTEKYRETKHRSWTIVEEQERAPK